MRTAGGKSQIQNFFSVVDFPHRHDGESTQLTGDDERLIFRVTYDTEAGISLKSADLGVEFGAELGVADIVYPPVDFSGRIGRYSS